MRESRRPSIFRRRFLIEPKVQLPLVLYLIGMNLVTLGVVYLAISLGMKRSSVELQAIAVQCSPILEQEVAELSVGFNRIFVGSGAVLLVFGVIGGVLISHRAVGPIFRLRKILFEANEGQNPETFKVRRHDYFQDIFPILENIIRKSKRDGD